MRELAKEQQGVVIAVCDELYNTSPLPTRLEFVAAGFAAGLKYQKPAPALQAENERLRAALRALVYWQDNSNGIDEGELDAIVKNARAALAKAAD